MTRRFFLVVIEPQGDLTYPTDDHMAAEMAAELSEAWFDHPVTVIPIDRGQAASCALGSGVPVSDIIGVRTEPYTGSHEPDGPCRVTTHVRVDGVCVRCGDRREGTEHAKWQDWALAYREDDHGTE